MAARRGKDRVEMVDFEDAKDKVLMGAERKSMIISEDEKRRRPTMNQATRWSPSCSRTRILFTR